MLVTVGRFLDPWEAHVVRARMLAEGIPASVMGDSHAIANWPMAFALGGTLLQVPSCFAADAARVLAAYRSGDLEQELVVGGHVVPERCSSCGGLEFTNTVPGPRRLMALALFLLGGATFPTSLARRCKACGRVWQAGSEGP